MSKDLNINEPPQASAGGSQPADESTELPNGHLGAARSEGTISAGKGPASGSPVDEMVLRDKLEELARYADSSDSPDDARTIRDALEALRALEAERDAWRESSDRHQSERDSFQRVGINVQREADQLREWLKEALEAWEDHVYPSVNSVKTIERISEIRSKMEKAPGVQT